MTRSSQTPFLVALTLFLASLHPTATLQNSNKFSPNYLPLNLLQISTAGPAFEAMMATRKKSTSAASNYPPRLSFQRASMVLVASLPIGTPSQSIPMVLDTGSQLSWIACDNKTNPKASFQHNRSKTFSYILCDPKKRKKKKTEYACRIDDNTLSPTCDYYHRCLYSYFYADGTLAEGLFVTEKFTFPNYRPTPPLTLGCARKRDSSGAEGILGMNLGPLSFTSQLGVKMFSYCVPKYIYNSKINPPGVLCLGPNPKSCSFRYVGLSKTPPPHAMPNFDPLLYSVPLVNITVGRKSVAVPPVSDNGAGQTIIDSGTQFTYLADDVYKGVAKLVSGLAGSRLPKTYDGFPMCFRGTSEDIGKRVGDLLFVFENRPRNVSVSISKGNLFVDVTPGVCCFTILSSGVFGDTSSNIIGNILQQNLWIEYDRTKKRIGFGSTRDCNK